MSTKTTNYNLHKIDLADAPPDITVLNANWDTIDTELKDLDSNKASSTTVTNHVNNKSNPHGVTAEQVGALPLTGGALSGALTVIDNFNVNKTYDNVEYKTYVRPLNYALGDEYTTGMIHYNNGVNNSQLLFNKNGVAFQDNVNSKLYQLFGQHNVATARANMGLGNTTGALPVANGGTGATTAEKALQNLGIIATKGEVINLNINQCYTGYISSDSTAVTFSVPLPKFLPSDASSITINSLRMNIRKVGGGYIGSSDSFVSGGEEYIGNSNYSVTYEGIGSRHMLTFTLKNKVSQFYTTNNTPVSLVGTLKFTIN